MPSRESSARSISAAVRQSAYGRAVVIARGLLWVSSSVKPASKSGEAVDFCRCKAEATP